MFRTTRFVAGKKIIGMRLLSPFIVLWFLLSDGKVLSKNNSLSKEKNLDIQIILPNREIQERNDPCFAVKILFINNTDTINSFFEDWNLWGWDNLYFEVKQRDSIFHIYKKFKGDFAKNFPSFRVLFPGDTMSFSYPLHECEFSQYAEPENHVRARMGNLITYPGNTISVCYNLDPLALKDVFRSGIGPWPDSTTLVKYKYNYADLDGSGKHNEKNRVIVDSVKNPVLLYQTFPLSLQSKEFPLY